MTENSRADWMYSNAFYDYIERGVFPSARAVIALVAGWLKPQSVLDVGCGRGAWLKIWKENGAVDVLGVDGAYVDALRLHVARDEFRAVDLASGFSLGRKFDLLQSLEVAEHLPPASSELFVSSLTAHADTIVFSAAVPGQGGENHQNERPLGFWRELFEGHGYTAFDAVRPRLSNRPEIEPWYRFNTVLYANQRAERQLPAEVIATRLAPGQPFADYGDLKWRLRRAAVGLLPRPVVDVLARKRAERIAKHLASQSR